MRLFSGPALLVMACLLLGLPWRGAAAAAVQAAYPTGLDPLPLYGPAVRYDILREGEKVGAHELRFRQTPQGLEIESRSQIEVNLLFLTAYSFRYQSVEHWRDGRLAMLYAATNDNGETSRVEARDAAGALRFRGASGSWQMAASSILPTTHWAMPRPGPAELLNTLTGNINRVTIAEAGREPVDLGGQTREARRFVYSGDLEVESWYDDAGRWVKLRFRAEDGSLIEYVCRSCQTVTSAAVGE